VQHLVGALTMLLLQMLCVAAGLAVLYVAWMLFSSVLGRLFGPRELDDIDAALQELSKEPSSAGHGKSKKGQKKGQSDKKQVANAPKQSKSELKAAKKDAEREAERLAARQALAKSSPEATEDISWMKQKDHELLQDSFKAHTKPILSCACSPDGKWIATCASDRCILLHHQSPAKRTKGGGEVARINISFDHAELLRFSDDAKAGGILVCTLADSGSVEMRSVQRGEGATTKTGDILATFPAGHTEGADFLRVASNCRSLLTGDTSSTIVKLHELKGKKLEHSLLNTMDTKKVKHYDMDMCATGRFVAITSFSDCKIWEVKRAHAKSGGDFESLKAAMHLGKHKGGAVRLNSDGTRVVLACNDARCRMFDLDVRFNLDEDPKLMWESELVLEGRKTCRMELSPDGDTVAVADANTICFLDAASGSVCGTVRGAHGLEGYTGQEGPLTGLSWLHDSTAVVSSGTDRTVRTWRNPNSA